MTSVGTELVLVALATLAVAPERTQRLLMCIREWLERNARTIAAVILLLLAAILMRDRIAGLTGPG